MIEAYSGGGLVDLLAALGLGAEFFDEERQRGILVTHFMVLVAEIEVESHPFLEVMPLVDGHVSRVEHGAYLVEDV